MVVAAAGAVAGLGWVSGEVSGGGQPETPLAGPKVATRKGTFGLSGEFKRETLRPEEMAIRNLSAEGLSLATEERAEVDRLFNQRGRVMTRFVLGNIDLLNRLNVSGAAGDKWATAALLIQGLGKFEATGIKGEHGGDFSALVRKALPEQHRGAFDREMSEYWVMVAIEKTGKMRSKLTRGEVYGARLEESIKIVGLELEAAFQRAERSGEFVVAYLLDGLKLSPTQKEKINGIVFSRMESLGEDAPESEKVKLLLGIMAYLTEAQQETLMKKIKGE
jgi:hypothetical protein